MLKRADDVIAACRKKLLSPAASAYIWGDSTVRKSAYPLSINLRSSNRELEAIYPHGFANWKRELHRLADGAGCAIEETPFHPGAGLPPLSAPKRIIAPNEAAASKLAGPLARAEIALRERRNAAIAVLGPSPEAADHALRRTRGYSDTDFESLISLASWCAENDTAGLAPREVPVPGVQGKFLDYAEHRELCAELIGKESLDLRDTADFVMLKYLDPGSTKLYGLCRPGMRDEGRADYAIERAIVVENKATFSEFPSLPNTVCLLGAGRAATKYIPAISWIARNPPKLIYWGDMDADGLEILSSIRQAGIECRSALMDMESFRRFERLGSSKMPDGRPIPVASREPSSLSLTEGERALYAHLSKPTTHLRRIEQEKIPYSEFLKYTNLVD